MTCKATSAGGTTTKAVTIKRDASPPTLTCQPATFVLGSKSTVKATVTDALSGPAGSTASAAADTSSAGPKAVLLSGKDKAGNSGTVSCAYTVAFKLAALKPAAGTAVQRGSTIQVQFRLQDSSGHAIADSLGRSLATSCSATISFTAGTPASNCFRYDDRSDTFLFDLPTSPTTVTGSQTITIRVSVGATVVNTASTSVIIRT